MPLFARSLTLVPRSLFLHCTETLATQARSWNASYTVKQSFFFFFSTSEKNSVKRGVRVLRALASHARRLCEARAVKQKVWNGAENRERDWGETLKIRTVRFAYVLFVLITRFSQARATPTG